MRTQVELDAVRDVEYLKQKLDVVVLLDWFMQCRRLLPWRAKNPNPYYVWLSEIMLQQTQVMQMRPYFERFIARFPSIFDLALAEEQEVMALWAGLGYYARARHMHRAAQIMVSQYQGLPQDAKAWSCLPGVGRYTLAAVRSIAYKEPMPVLDGNVLRVMSRFLAVPLRRGQISDEKKLWQWLESWFKTNSDIIAAPGDVNQALMELGATICRPVNPECPVCPLRGSCAAYKYQTTDQYPLPKEKITIKKIKIAALWCVRDSQVLVMRRAAQGLWGKMTALPCVEHLDTWAQAPVQIENLLAEWGVQTIYQIKKIKRTQRILTHRQVDLVLYQVDAKWPLLRSLKSKQSQDDEQPQMKWIDKSKIDTCGLPQAFLVLVKNI